MKDSHRSPLSAVFALIGWSIGCGPAAPGDSELGALEAGLFARSRALWPVVDEVVPVRVCWAPPQLRTTYPVAALRPDLEALLPERQRWVREVVEEQWNGRTPLRFTGWEDCAAGPADVELTPIDTGVTSPCASGNLGQPCVGALGRELVGGGAVFLNLFFGEEVLYSSRYQQASPGAAYDVRNEPNAGRAYSYWLPQACFDELQYAWSTHNTLTRYPVDVDDPGVFAEFMAIYEDCSKFNALHEFGHIAGFSHEQQRADAPPGCEPEREPDVPYVGDTPLGPFDAESIMSYCRADEAATLSEEDAEQTHLVYLGHAAEALDEQADVETAAPGNEEAAAGASSSAPAPAGPAAAEDGEASEAAVAASGSSATATMSAPAPAGRDASSGSVSSASAASDSSTRTPSGDPRGSSARASGRGGGCSLATRSPRGTLGSVIAIGALVAAAARRRARAPRLVRRCRALSAPRYSGS